MPKSLSTSLLYWLNAYLPPLFWAGVIFAFSSQKVLPSLETSVLDFVFKKLAHMAVFAILYILVVRAQKMTFTPSHRLHFWSVPVLVCFLYALSDEFHQALVGGSRTPSLRDVVFDMLGVLVPFLRQYRYI